MANRLYDLAREKFLNGTLSWLSMDFKICAVDGAEYTPDTATDEYLSDVGATAIVSTTAALSSKTITGGVADAADTVLSSVTGDEFEYLVLFRDDGGVAASSELVAIWDTVTGLPFTPGGSDITLQFDSGANKIFRL